MNSLRFNSVINFVAATRMPAINRQQHPTWKDYIKKFVFPRFFDKSIYSRIFWILWNISCFRYVIYHCISAYILSCSKHWNYLLHYKMISISVNIVIVRKNYNHLLIFYEASFIKLHNTEYKPLIILCYTIACDKVHSFKMWLIQFKEFILHHWTTAGIMQHIDGLLS